VTSVLVIGAGSIGRRHARNLLAAGADVAICDPIAERAHEAGAARPVPFDLAGLDAYDGIVVASPTAFHADHVRVALAAGLPVLVEKPLAITRDGIDDIIAAGDCVMVGFNLRFHRPVARAVELVHEGRAGAILAARAWFGSWLPDWRPSVDYRTTYSARRDLGGGVLLDAIHELDVLVWLFGDNEFRVLGALVGRVGPLEVDVEDTVKALLEHGGIPIELSLDYLSRAYRRGIEVIGDRATVRLDWSRRVLEIENADEVITEQVEDSLDRSYERQADAFLEFVRGGPPLPVDARTAAASLRLADAIRCAGA
jgi:predicted dehydrogenase